MMYKYIKRDIEKCEIERENCIFMARKEVPTLLFMEKKYMLLSVGIKVTKIIFTFVHPTGFHRCV